MEGENTVNLDEASASAVSTYLATLTAEPAEPPAQPQEPAEPAAEAAADAQLETGGAEQPADPDADASGEGGEAAEGDPAGVTDEPVVDVDPEAWVLVDGERVKFKDAVEIKSVSTKRTQEAARIREEADTVKAAADTLHATATQMRADAEETYNTVKSWSDSVIQDPGGFAAELVSSGKVDPTAMAVFCAEAAEDSTMLAVQLLVHLTEAGKLDPTFVETFGLNDPQHPARVQVRNERANAGLRKELAAVKAQQAALAAPAPAPAPAAVDYAAEAVAELTSLAESEGIPTSGPEFEQFTVKVLGFVQDKPRYAADLGRAYDRMQLEELRAEKAATPVVKATTKKPAPITARSGGSVGAGGGAAKPARTSSIADASQRAADEFFARYR